jgi:DNA polymerase-3 subunit delta'
MPLTPVFGHEDLRRRLAAAIATDRLPQVLLLTGAEGVGKQRLGLWLAQRLVCAAAGAEPCGRCVPCRQVLGLAHPDVHWVVPVPRPKAGEPDKQVEEVAESLEAAMAERRQGGAWGPSDGMASHGIASARWLQRKATLTAALGGWRIFLIGRADRLVPQESSPEAANALLKLLEEPPARSVFVLTAAEPGLVLPTIRSRSVPVRVGRVSDEAVRAFAAERGLATDDETVARARGVIGRLLVGDDSERVAARDAALAVLRAVDAGTSDRAALALRRSVSQARGEFTVMLDALAALLTERTRLASGGGPGGVASAVAAMALVMAAREQAQGNVNPQMLLAVLMDDLAALEAA